MCLLLSGVRLNEIMRRVSGYYESSYVSRPGILTAVGVGSIIIASISLIVDCAGLSVANVVSHFAVRGGAPSALNSAPLPAALPPASADEYVAPDGLSASQRKIVIAGLSQARALSDARQKQIDGLLADVGQEVIQLSADNLTAERVTAYVTEVRNIPSGSGGAADDLFILGSGRLQVSDESAVFFAGDSPSGIRSRGGSYTDSSGTHMASGQIAAVVDRVRNLCPAGQAMNDLQMKALEGTLESPSQTLITPSPSAAEAAAQVQSVQSMGDGTIAVIMNGGSMSFGPTGQALAGVTSASQMMWKPPVVVRRDTTLLMLDAVLSLAAAGYLLACGIVVLRNLAVSRWMTMGYAIGKLLLGVLSCYSIYQVAMELGSKSPDAESTAFAWMMIVGGAGLVYPIVLLIVMNLKGVREFLGTPTVARIFEVWGQNPRCCAPPLNISGFWLLLAEDDSASGQVVGGEFYLDLVAREDADEMLAHFAGNVAEDFSRGAALV